jgi:hypothetical protein
MLIASARRAAMFADTENRCGTRVWGRAAVALGVALAAVCVMVPAAQAQSIAFQRSDGGLWICFKGDDTCNDLKAGMAAGTSPSINNLSVIAFQANTGNLDVTGKGDLHLGMMSGAARASTTTVRSRSRRTAASSGRSEAIASMAVGSWG